MLMSFWARLSEGLRPVRARHQRGQDIGHGVGGAAVAGVPDLPKAASPLESLFGGLDQGSDTRLEAESRLLRRLLDELAPRASSNLNALGFLKLFSRETSATVMPYQLQVK